MNKMKKFAWIFMVAALVAGFSACDNIEDDIFPGLGEGGNGSEDKEEIFTWEFTSSFGEFTTQDVLGDETWVIDYSTAKMTGYVNSENRANEDWLISPAITLNNVTAAKLKMEYIARYFSNLATDITVQVSEDYTEGAPSTAQWTELSPASALVSGSDWTTFASTEYSLTPYVGKTIRFAIKYVSTTAKAGTIEVKSVTVDEGEVEGGTPDTPDTPDTPSTVMLTDTLYQFNNIVDNYTPINELCAGWAHEIVSPADDNRTWQAKTYGEDKYIQATAHDGSDGNAGKSYDLWMITPALDVKNAPQKVFSFFSQGGYWKETSKLEVYVLNEQTSNASSKTLINPTIATSADGDFKWVASGDIDLSSYGDVVYVAFRYIAEGGKSNSTTYCIDDFAFGRNQVAMGGGSGEEPGTGGEESIFSWDFSTSFGEFTTQDVLGDEAWMIDYSTAKMTGYVNSTNYANEDWLISPAITLNNVTAAKLKMTYIARYFSNLPTDITVLVSENYTEGAPSTAQWTEVAPASALVSGSDWTTFSTTEYSLTSHVGKTIRFAIKYVSTEEKAGTIEVKSVTVEEGEATGTDEPGTGSESLGNLTDVSDAISVAEALTHDNAAKDVVLVKGYIVGCLAKECPTSFTDIAAVASSVEMGKETYTGSTTVIIADSADETDLTKCIWVKLNDKVSAYPGAEGLRSAVALDAHPENVGKVLYAKGKKMAMFTGLPGVRDMEGWQLGE